MRETDDRSGGPSMYLIREVRTAAQHPLRSIETTAVQEFEVFSPDLELMYASPRCPSIPSENPLRELPLQAIYSGRCSQRNGTGSRLTTW